ncbi:MAG: hypothetical protein PWQ63_1124 [Methanolobus sp.]|jgi:hypothetical protein|nr:hypothetical protein [Methanolobus sp.]MDK2947964.1 hypothetical protein [Methanolobus sp.]
MKNIWTQHLERSNNDDRNRENTFSQMLHSLVKNENEDYLQVASTETPDSGNRTYKLALSKTETEIKTWVAESHKGYELGMDSLKKDSVRLILSEDGRLILRYDVAGETPFEMAVKSEEEAQNIIDEDNETTEQLYPDNPELKWIKII